ncbi:MAG: WYL domain-containing protein [Verrucomicrobia bacterium]|nr:WYL domain-containing protein [Verrucomicrobiota bacterium]
MGNKTNDQNWAVRQRLRFIETCAWWKGAVQRQDLAGLFGLSMAQASSDLQRYLELNPVAFVYNLRQKRYEATAEMKCLLTKPRLDEAVARFLGGDATSTWTGWTDESEGGGCVAVLRMPEREAGAAVERRIFLAVLNGQRVKVRYASVHSGSEEWRWLRPHALGHNGARWHVRAWCETNGDFRDFTLSRIAEVEWSRERAELPAEDKDWKQWVTLRVRPHQDLNEAQHKAVERDYAMRGRVLKLRVRKAMEGYLRDRLGLAMADGKPPVRLLECDEKTR